MRRIIFLLLLSVAVLAGCSSGKHDFSDLKVKQETRNLILICSEKDEGYLENLASALENSYDTVTDHLGHKTDKKVTVYMHPDLDKLHNALGIPDAPDWVRGGYANNAIHVVSPHYTMGLPVENIVVHEFTHLIIAEINPKTPRWLNEGLASYEGKEIDKNWIKNIISSKIISNQIPAFETINNDYKTFGEDYGYEFSYTIVEFMVKEFSFDQICTLIKSPHDFEGAFAMSEQDVWEKWKVYLNSNYK